MPRIVVIGNAGGGKSTLARKLATQLGLRHVEIDRWLWQEGWVPTPAAEFSRLHTALIAADAWVIDGLGRRESIGSRLARATDILLVDMPLWIHFWLAAERQIAWAAGTLEHPPAGLSRAPPTQALFRTIWEVDRDWMPEIRTLCADAEALGITVTRLGNIADLDRISAET